QVWRPGHGQRVHEEGDVHPARRRDRDLASDLTSVGRPGDRERCAPGVASVQRAAEDLVLSWRGGYVQAQAGVTVADVSVARLLRSCNRACARLCVVVDSDCVLVVEE